MQRVRKVWRVGEKTASTLPGALVTPWQLAQGIKDVTGTGKLTAFIDDLKRILLREMAGTTADKRHAIRSVIMRMPSLSSPCWELEWLTMPYSKRDAMRHALRSLTKNACGVEIKERGWRVVTHADDKDFPEALIKPSTVGAALAQHPEHHWLLEVYESFYRIVSSEPFTRTLIELELPTPHSPLCVSIRAAAYPELQLLTNVLKELFEDRWTMSAKRGLPRHLRRLER